MFSSFLRQGSQGGTFLRLGVSRVDESNDIIGIHPGFGVATILRSYGMPVVVW